MQHRQSIWTCSKHISSSCKHLQELLTMFGACASALPVLHSSSQATSLCSTDSPSLGSAPQLLAPAAPPKEPVQEHKQPHLWSQSFWRTDLMTLTVLLPQPTARSLTPPLHHQAVKLRTLPSTHNRPICDFLQPGNKTGHSPVSACDCTLLCY